MRRTAAVLMLLAGSAEGARAQRRLVDPWTAASGAVVENWSLPTPPQVATPAGSPMYVRTPADDGGTAPANVPRRAPD